MSRHKKTQDYEISALLDEDPTALGDRKVYDLEDPNFRAESAKYRVTQYPEDFCCKYTAAGEEVLFCIFCVKIINTKSSRVSEHVKSIKHLENKGENDPYFTINQAFNTSILTPDPNEDDNIAQEEYDTTGPGYVNTKDPYQIVNLFPDDVILAIQGPNDSDRAFCKFCNEFQISSSSSAVSHLSTKKHFESKNKQMKLVSQIKPFQPAKTKVLKQASPPPKRPRPFILHRSADGPQLPRPKHSAGGPLLHRPKPETSESRPAEPCDEDYYKIRGTCARLCDLPVTQAQTGVHDVEIVCADGRLFSHKALVCHYSTLLRQHQRDTWASRELLTIFIPQVNVYIVRKLLEFLQNRPVKLKRDEVKHFRQVYTLLQIDLVPVEKLDFKPLGVGKSVSSKRKTPPPTTMNKTSKKQRLLVENIKQEAISVEDIQDPLLATNPNQLRRNLKDSGDVDERGDLNGEVTAQEYGQPRALQHEDEHAQQDEFMEEGNADQDELLEGGNADQDELQEEEDHPEPDELQEEEDAEQNELLEVDHEEGNENQIEEEDARPQNGWEAAIQAELKGTSVDHLSDEAENIVSCEDDAMSEDESEDDFTVEYLEGGDGGS